MVNKTWITFHIPQRRRNKCHAYGAGVQTNLEIIKATVFSSSAPKSVLVQGGSAPPSKAKSGGDGHAAGGCVRPKSEPQTHERQTVYGNSAGPSRRATDDTTDPILTGCSLQSRCTKGIGNNKSRVTTVRPPINCRAFGDHLSSLRPPPP